jgi:hypothetical protein
MLRLGSERWMVITRQIEMASVVALYKKTSADIFWLKRCLTYPSANNLPSSVDLQCDFSFGKAPAANFEKLTSQKSVNLTNRLHMPCCLATKSIQDQRAILVDAVFASPRSVRVFPYTAQRHARFGAFIWSLSLAMVLCSSCSYRCVCAYILCISACICNLIYT